MKKDVPYPQQKDNFETLKKDQRQITQREIMARLADKDQSYSVTEATVSAWFQGKKQISHTNAAHIAEVFPEYSVEFLRGETPYRNTAEQARSIFLKVAKEGKELQAAVSMLAELSGFHIDHTSSATYEKTGDSVVDVVHEYAGGCDIIRGNRLLHLDMDEMSAFENYVCDFVELTLDRLMKTKGIERKEM